MSLIPERRGWLLLRCYQELLNSIKHILRDGMPRTSDNGVDNLIKAAQSELEQSPDGVYYKMYVP
jgi:hypothetical protein